MEVTGQTHYNTHKMEDTHNHFMVVSGSLEEVTASLGPSSWTVYATASYFHPCRRLYIYIAIEYIFNMLSEIITTPYSNGVDEYTTTYTEHKNITEWSYYRLSCIMLLLTALVE